MEFKITNKSMELNEVKDQWFYDEKYDAWCLEDLLYTDKAKQPKFQRLSIYVPGAYMMEGGVFNPEGRVNGYQVKSAPIIFANNSAGYMMMPHMWLGGPRCHGDEMLRQGYVYITPGNRGHESKDSEGNYCGKAPWNLIDLKTAIRFLRHNKDVIPGDFEHIISTGWSAGGAMSVLLGVTGDHTAYQDLLEENGAFMEESDSVFACQVYCPIVDLEHADPAYEWMFHADKENEASPAGPQGVMTPFQEALSELLMKKYVSYFNGLGLKNPDTGEALVLNGDARSGSGYDYLMEKINASATKYLRKLEARELNEKYTVEDYLSGDYIYLAPAPMGKKPDEADLMSGHAGPGVALAKKPDRQGPPPTLGEMLSRPPKGQEKKAFKPPMVEKKGSDKREWLSWDGKNAKVKDLDSYVLHHRRRMKPCTSFDTLEASSGENALFGTNDHPKQHFNPDIAELILQLKDRFPEEYEKYYEGYKKAADDKEIAEREHLINPLHFIGTEDDRSSTKHYRVRVGASDADTSFAINLSLALKLMNAGKDASYELVWDKPHCEADYPGELARWINGLCG